MATMNLYEGPGNVLLDSSVLAEAKSVRVSIASGNTPVKTMKKALAGRSKGATMTTIEITEAVPVAGLEADFVEKLVENANVRIEYVSAGKRYQVEGWVDAVEASNDTDADAQFSFTVIGGPPSIT